MTGWDVLIAGAGPAGSVAALVLAKTGFNVILADVIDGSHPKIGESLPGIGPKLLCSLGLDCSAFGPVHSTIGGNLICWSSKEPEATDSICNPDGPAWRLARHKFDSDLFHAAQSKGTRHQPDRIASVTRKEERWECRTTSGETFSSRWLIDASGRTSSLARHLGVTRFRDKGLVALYAFGDPPPQTFDRTLIEAVPQGWWYGAVLPEGRALAVLYVLPEQARAARQNWRRAFASTSLIRNLLPVSHFRERPLPTNAAGSRLANFYGHRWIACGDAAIALDPLSAQGIYTALFSGMSAAKAIIATENGDSAALPSYGKRLQSIWNIYWERLATSYQSVSRWPTEPFWRVQSRLASAADGR